MRFSLGNLLIAIVFACVTALMLAQHYRFLEVVELARKRGEFVCGNPGLAVFASVPMAFAGWKSLLGHYRFASILGAVSFLAWGVLGA